MGAGIEGRPCLQAAQQHTTAATLQTTEPAAGLCVPYWPASCACRPQLPLPGRDPHTQPCWRSSNAPAQAPGSLPRPAAAAPTGDLLGVSHPQGHLPGVGVLPVEGDQVPDLLVGPLPVGGVGGVARLLAPHVGAPVGAQRGVAPRLGAPRVPGCTAGQGRGGRVWLGQAARSLCPGLAWEPQAGCRGSGTACALQRQLRCSASAVQKPTKDCGRACHAQRRPARPSKRAPSPSRASRCRRLFSILARRSHSFSSGSSGRG